MACCSHDNRDSACSKQLSRAAQASFGDFFIFRMDEILEGRFNGGFARAATVRSAAHVESCSMPASVLLTPAQSTQVSSSEFAAAQMDPVAAFSAPIARHM